MSVGDVVVYGQHGPGRIAARDERVVLGAAQEVLVLEFGDGLSVTLPIERARALLRPVLGEEDLVRVQETLRVEHALSDDGWLRRRKATEEKMAGGDPLGLAEVVRDGARRQQRLMPKSGGSKLSTSEKDAYLKALKLLSEEIGLARGVEPAEAEAWIEQQLAATA